MISFILLFAGSLFVLIYASSFFIDSAERIGLSFGISPFVIGVTIVAFGTSLPELATSVLSVLSGSSEIVVGNVVGSNITNILFVLGASAIFSGNFSINRDLMEDDIPLLVGSAVLLYFALRDQVFSILEIVLFSIGLIAYLVYSLKNTEEQDEQEVSANVVTYLILVVSGVAVYFGASYTVLSIERISELLEINPAVVSLSALALGTSLPEVVVSIAACRRGLHDMAIGNILGSNLFNTFGVMAIPALVGPLSIPASINEFSVPFLIAVTIIFGLVCYSKKVSVWEGIMLVSLYIMFLAELINMGFVN